MSALNFSPIYNVTRVNAQYGKYIFLKKTAALYQPQE